MDIVKPKDKIVMVRFSTETFTQVEKLAKKHKTSKSKVIRALVEESLKTNSK